MTTSTHPVSPEEIMAFVDGELAAAEMQAVSLHIEGCTECAAVAQEFRSLSQSLSHWQIEAVPAQFEEVMQGAITGSPTTEPSSAKGSSIRRSITWKPWIYGLGGAIAAALILVVSVSTFSRHQAERENAVVESRQRPSAIVAPEYQDKVEVFTDSPAAPNPDLPLRQSIEAPRSAAYAPMPAMPTPPPPPVPTEAKEVIGGIAGDQLASKAAPAPMIARTVSLTIQVKNIPTARAALDTILAQHHGYAAQLTVNTPENAARSFQASLRIPAQDLIAALGDLKRLGRVENETQSGEEVTQQHTDLVARLKTARETEERFRAILQQRTGKIEDVLSVEQEIERVRGEIEGMEAEQKALEHRVDFASVELALAEEYKAQLTSPPNSVSTRMHNAFVSGYRNASETVVGIALFFIEYGPTILIILAIIGLPTFFVWRRYRRNLARL